MTNYEHEQHAIDAQLSDDLLKRIEITYKGTGPWLFVDEVRGLENLSDYERTLVHAFLIGHASGVALARQAAGESPPVTVEIIGNPPE